MGILYRAQTLVCSRRASTIAHIYPSVLQALAGRSYVGPLGRVILGCWGVAMQDPGHELPRIPIPRTQVNSASTKVGYTESLASRKEISVRQEQVAEVMNDPLSQELLHSAIPARIAYNGTDGFPRAIPIGFLWKDGRIVVCTASNAYKVKALEARPEVALTIDADSQPYRALLVRGTASMEIVDGVPSDYLAAARKVMKDGEHVRAA